MQSAAAQGLDARERLGDRPRAVGIHHEADIGPHRLPRGLDRRDRDLVNFDEAVPLRGRARRHPADDLRLAVAEQARIGAELALGSAAEEAVQRLAAALPGDVPQGDVDRRQGVNHRPIASEEVELLRRLGHEAGDVRRVAADEVAGDQRIEGRLCGRRHGMSEALPPAGDAVLGLDLDQEDRHAAPALSGERLRGRPRLVRNVDEDGRDRSDLHGASVSLEGAAAPPDERWGRLSARAGYPHGLMRATGRVPRLSPGAAGPTMIRTYRHSRAWR